MPTFLRVGAGRWRHLLTPRTDPLETNTSASRVDWLHGKLLKFEFALAYEAHRRAKVVVRMTTKLPFVVINNLDTSNEKKSFA